MSDRFPQDAVPAAAALATIAKRLTWGTSGNLSVRLDAEHFVISASGVPLDELDERHVACCEVRGES